MYVSVLLAWQFSRLDAWSTWILLTLLAIYDALAVGCSCGPLNMLVNLMNSNPNNEIPGLFYEAKWHHDNLRSRSPEDREANRLREDADERMHHVSRIQTTVLERDQIRLGLGDFVFYSLLLSRAAMQGLATFFTSYVFLLCVSHDIFIHIFI